MDMLEKLFPNLKEELIYCAPEMLWLKVKHITGLDIIDIMESINNKIFLKKTLLILLMKNLQRNILKYVIILYMINKCYWNILFLFYCKY